MSIYLLSEAEHNAWGLANTEMDFWAVKTAEKQLQQQEIVGEDDLCVPKYGESQARFHDGITAILIECLDLQK